jgi:hypothetical protein
MTATLEPVEDLAKRIEPRVSFVCAPRFSAIRLESFRKRISVIAGDVRERHWAMAVTHATNLAATRSDMQEGAIVKGRIFTDFA